MSYLKVVSVRGRPGYALMEIGYALSVDPVQFTLQRVGVDQRYLGRDGRWRADPEPLEPQRVDRHADRTVLGLGPDVVNCLEDDERLRVEISSTGFAADIVWSDIPRSTGRVGSAVFSKPEPPPPGAAPPPPPSAPPPEAVASAPKNAAPVTDPEKPRHRVWPWALLALLVLVVAGAAGWRYRAELLALVVPLKPAPDNELQRIKVEVTELIRTQQCDAARIFDGGRRLLRSDKPELRDFGFRAVDAAAGCGFPGAQLEMGRLYDPRHFQAGRVGLDNPNPSIAAEWYARSKNGGSSEAGAELSGLCDQLRNPSGQDEEARMRIVTQYCN